MKSVLIITRHAIANYGSLLQAIALQEKVSQLGYQPKIIDYVTKEESIGYRTITEGKTKDKWKKNKIMLFLYCLTRLPMDILSDYKFVKYSKQYLSITERFSSIEELKKKKPIADLYLTGSDQVWGPIMNGEYDWAYFLDFCQKTDKKAAYASSFGKASLPQNVKEKALYLLKEYDYLSVREESAVDFLYKNGINSTQVLDPTLLLTASEWEKLLSVPSRRIQKKYAVVYQIHNNKELEEYAVEFAKRAGVKLIRISPLLHQINRGGKFIWSPSLGEFISYIKYADYLITDSFHGTVFSIIFNTPLVTLLPKTGTSTRNKSILKLLHLEDRIVSNSNTYDLVDRRVDFSYSNNKLQEKRDQSIEILKMILELSE